MKRIALSLVLGFSFSCSSDPGGAPFGSGGTGTGGISGSSGGASSGGNVATGGVATGGTASGGAASGGTASGGAASGGGAGTFGRQIFLLIGQSNMEGVPTPQSADQVTNPRVFVLGYDAGCQGRTWNEWSVAAPPLHRCWAGVGPGDSFGRAMAEAWPEAEIGLVPCAISGVDIDFFREGVVSARRSEFQIPPDDTRSGAYEMVLERARVAQESGVIRGILFHQGESDSGNSAAWVTKVTDMVADLREDLELGEDVPFVAGELLPGASHNAYVNQLPSVIPNAHVVSSSGLSAMDQYHFDLTSQRTLGERYAEKVLDALE